MFHVSLLKPFKPRGNPSQYLPLPELVEGEEEQEVEQIVNHRIKEYKRKGRDSKTVRSFFVKWKGFSSDHDEWVTEANMTADFTIRNSLLDEYCNSHDLALTVIKSGSSGTKLPRSNKRSR